MKRLFLILGIATVMVDVAAAQALDQTLVLDVNASGSGPEALAAHAPAGGRAQTARQLGQVLDAYHQVEQKLGLQANEPAGALASFVTGTVSAAQHVDVPDAVFAALVTQLRGALKAHPELVATLHLDRRPVIEQIEILGLMMFVSERNKPAPSTAEMMATGAQHYVQQYLGCNVADLELTTSGLRFRRAPTGPLAVLAGGAAAREPRGTAPSESADRSAAAVGDIETIGFETRTQVGVGGSFIFVPAPVVLFKSGELVLDIGALGDPQGLAHHKQERPNEWTTWRRNGGVIERMKDGKWTKLSYTKTMGPLPAKFTLDGAYHHTGGGGNVAYGGDISIAAWSELRFDRSGSFSTGGGASATSTTVVASGQRATTSGSYAISGYTLTLHHADGHTEVRSIVADPKDLSVVWINGVGFTSK